MGSVPRSIALGVSKLADVAVKSSADIALNWLMRQLKHLQTMRLNCLMRQLSIIYYKLNFLHNYHHFVSLVLIGSYQIKKVAIIMSSSNPIILFDDDGRITNLLNSVQRKRLNLKRQSKP